MNQSGRTCILDLTGGVRRLQLAILLAAAASVAYGVHALPGEPQGGDVIPEQAVRFRHTDALHSRMPCLLCHKRAEGLTTPKWPGHQTCSGCHEQQFAQGNSSPLCNVCHTSIGLKPFPPQRSFTARYDHARHANQANCATCHNQNRRGVGLSVPSGVSAHMTCFRCHGPETNIGGRNIGSCNTCHIQGSPVRNSDASRAYSVNFSHQEHTRKGLSCATCHSLRPGQARGRQVTEPAVSMHFPPAGVLSCGACHNGKRAFGPNDFQNCRRCHEGKTFQF